MLRALIFDVDGTLAETEELHRKAFNEVFAQSGLDWHWSRETYTELLKTTGGKERMKAYRELLRADTPDDATIAQLHRQKTDLYVQLMQDGQITLRPGVRDLVDQARNRGLALAIATTTSRPNVEALTQACWGAAASDVFDVIAAGDEVAAKKPAPDVYALALHRLDLPARHAVAIEDTRNGILSARSAGLRVVVTPSIYSAAEDFFEATDVMPHLCGLDELAARITA